jgi:hypothetical protein
MSKQEYCTYCQEEGHSVEDCWCTRPVGWEPTKIVSNSCLLKENPNKCACGYPQPCSLNVPITFCKQRTT